MIKKIFLLSALLFVITSCGENYSSKKCLGNNYEKWTNCTSEYTWKNGTNYIGEWMNGKASGHGKMVWYWGDVYIGEFKDGKPNGLGTMTWSNLQKKIGVKEDGYGTFDWPSGSKYVGEWKNGLMVTEFILGLTKKIYVII